MTDIEFCKEYCLKYKQIEDSRPNKEELYAFAEAECVTCPMVALEVELAKAKARNGAQLKDVVLRFSDGTLWEYSDVELPSISSGSANHYQINFICEHSPTKIIEDKET